MYRISRANTTGPPSSLPADQAAGVEWLRPACPTVNAKVTVWRPARPAEYGWKEVIWVGQVVHGFSVPKIPPRHGQPGGPRQRLAGTASRHPPPCLHTFSGHAAAPGFLASWPRRAFLGFCCQHIAVAAEGVYTSTETDPCSAHSFSQHHESVAVGRLLALWLRVRSCRAPRSAGPLSPSGQRSHLVCGTEVSYGSHRRILVRVAGKKEGEVSRGAMLTWPDQRIPGYIKGYVRRFWQVCGQQHTSPTAPSPDR